MKSSADLDLVRAGDTNAPCPLAATRVPRWPEPGLTAPATTTCETEISTELHARLLDTADRCSVTPGALLLAAHLAVLGAIASDVAPVTGLVTGEQASPHPVRTELPGRTWRELATLAAEAPSEVGLESVLDLSPAGTADHGEVLRVRFAGGRLRVSSRADLLNAGAAARIAGYHLTALQLLTDDVDGTHRPQDLLSQREIRHQLRDFAGERVPLGERMFVELFEEQVRLRPDDVAVSHRDETWTYRELNARANQVAHALRDNGLAAEEIVAVVTERDPLWAAATLGVLKAGGAYLPVDPRFPVRRIAGVLDQAGCRLTLTGRGAEPVLDAVRSGDRRALTIMGCLSTARASDPRVPIAPDSLAYVYFTSGSTGTPKGVMCEHAGMLNHLLAKVQDMRVGPGDVVAQTSSQCFDISLWQLIGPLLTGGSARIVDTGVLLDVDLFLDELAESGARVVQLVPSYFEVLVSRLERGSDRLGSVRSVSVTGEVLRTDLARRWFACCPGVTLVNAYGATELSDDTTHAVLQEPPREDFVPLGSALRNVDAYVLGEDLSLLPLGAPGEIAFSGVCVGRGYLNDEAQTNRVFVPDPHRPGHRLYRTGDFGRWLPGGALEFLGRRDEQVKIRGVRVEIGEVETWLARMPGVTSAAVVVDSGHDLASILVAFFTGSGELDAGAVREHLAARLPDHLVPTYVHRLERLPLTANGKVDKAVLVTLAATLGHADGPYVAPGTPTERQLATAWAEVLHVPLERIGHADNFFTLGGTSLSVVRLLAKLDRLVSLRQIVAHPTLSDLAAVIDGSPRTPVDRLLQPLSSVRSGVMATLVCFPHAGGNSVNFQMLARELDEHRVAVYGVELPGHDLDAGAEDLVTVDEVAAGVHAELRELTATPLLLWGQCTGAAHALAVTRMLEQDSASPLRVFLGGILLETEDELRAEAERVRAMDERALVASILEDSGYVEVDGLKPERAGIVGAAYRHDVCSAGDFLIRARRDPSAHRVRTDVHVVVAADDPHTAGRTHRLPEWAPLTGELALRELSEGGHYFPSTRAADVAALVLEACAMLAHRHPV